MDLAEYQKFREGDQAPGWEAITARLEQAYPGVKELHLVPRLHASLGGDDYLNGVSVFRCGEGDDWHWHYVTYGYSNLFYDEEAINDEDSGWGFEMTLRVRPFQADGDNPHGWVAGLLQNLARYVFTKRRPFAEGHCVPANGPIRLGTETQIVGLAFTLDPVLGAIDTPHGRVEFLQAVGITQAELDALRATTTTPAEVLAALRAADPLLVTDLTRTS